METVDKVNWACGVREHRGLYENVKWCEKMEREGRTKINEDVERECWLEWIARKKRKKLK